MTRRWPGRVLVLGGLALLAILVTSAIDHRVTASRLPEVGIFTPDRPASSVPAVAEKEKLEDGFVARAWLYSLASIITVVVVTVAGLRSAPRARWHALFTDLGVAAVCALGLSSVISLIGPMLLDPVSKLPIWLPPVVMLVGAGVGSLLTRREDEALAVGGVPANGPPSSPRGDSGGGSPGSLVARIGRITLGLAVLNRGPAGDLERRRCREWLQRRSDRWRVGCRSARRDGQRSRGRAMRGRGPYRAPVGPVSSEHLVRGHRAGPCRRRSHRALPQLGRGASLALEFGRWTTCGPGRTQTSRSSS